MRIAVIYHALHEPSEVESQYAIGRLSEIWREQGHEVRALVGCRDRWPADVAILNVDLSVVPSSYAAFARSYPVAVNDRISDIRKRTISRNLVSPGSDYQGRVIVKTDLNSAGIPERRLLPRSPWRQWRRRLLGQREAPIEYAKKYAVYESVRQVPEAVLARPDLVVEKFLPEVDGDWFFVRRCFGLGGTAVSYRMGDRQPIVDGGVTEAFQWIDNSPAILALRRRLGLDYGVVDYTEHQGDVVVFDVNKTPGRAQPPDERGRHDYDTLLRRVAAGIDGLAPSRQSQVS